MKRDTPNPDSALTIAKERRTLWDHIAKALEEQQTHDQVCTSSEQSKDLELFVAILAERFTLSADEVTILSSLLGSTNDQQISTPRKLVDKMNQILMGSRHRILAPDGSLCLLRVQVHKGCRPARTYTRLCSGNGKLGPRIGKATLPIRKISRDNPDSVIELATD